MFVVSKVIKNDQWFDEIEKRKKPRLSFLSVHGQECWELTNMTQKI